MEKHEEMGTSLQEAGWTDENLGRAELEDESTEQECIELARALVVIDYSDGELDSDSDSDTYSDEEDDSPHLYDNIPFPSRTPTDPTVSPLCFLTKFSTYRQLGMVLICTLLVQHLMLPGVRIHNRASPKSS
jgi:hypothetical protein